MSLTTNLEARANGWTALGLTVLLVAGGWSLADQDVAIEALDQDQVITDEGMPASDERKAGLAFADAARAEDERPRLALVGAV